LRTLRALLLTNFIDRPGGAGRLEAYLIKALASLSQECILVAPGRPHKSNMPSDDDIRACKFILVREHDRVQSLQKILEYPPISLMGNLVGETLIEKIIERTRPDMIIASGGMSKRVATKAHRVGVKTIVYYHMITPWYVEIRGFYRRYKWSDLSMLWFGFNVAVGRLSSIDFEPWSYVDHVIVNSKYMAYLAKKYWGREPDVLQPPIEVKNFAIQPRENRSFEIVSIGRLDPDKRYEELIEAVGRSTVLKGKVKIRLAGFTGKYEYLLNVLGLAKAYDVKMVIERDVSEKRKQEILSNSMVFVNSSRYEHFGINVVEAMASGTPVIVHKSGGPYFDVIDRGIYGLSYTTVDELSDIIEMLVDDIEVWNKYSQLAIERARHYDFEVFKQRLLNVIGRLM
jgi:glycosyltransferase involved in cell wall biosynthesis